MCLHRSQEEISPRRFCSWLPSCHFVYDIRWKYIHQFSLGVNYSPAPRGVFIILKSNELGRQSIEKTFFIVHNQTDYCTHDVNKGDFWNTQQLQVPTQWLSQRATDDSFSWPLRSDYLPDNSVHAALSGGQSEPPMTPDPLHQTLHHLLHSLALLLHQLRDKRVQDLDLVAL